MAQVGLLTAIPQMAGLAALLFGARRSDRSGERRYHIAVPAVAAALAWMAMPLFGHNPIALVLLLIVVAGGVFGASASFWALPSRYLRKGEAAIGIAVVTTIGGLGSMASPLIVGWLADHSGGVAAGQRFYGAVLLAGAFAMLIATSRLESVTPVTTNGARTV